MNEMICRAKDKNGYWREGYYVRHENRQPCVVGDGLKDDEIEHYIFYDGFADWNMPRNLEAIEVDPETICGFIGMYDAHGKRIFEHDVVRIECGYYEVRWNPECVGFQLWREDTWYATLNVYVRGLEIIGNIFDNPNAMEGK